MYMSGPGGLPIEQVGSDGSIQYYLQDQLGSTRGLTDASGSIVASYSYDAYGNLTSSGTASTPFQYAGQYTDGESGLQYLRARYYDPQTAQFLSVDPLAGLTQQPYAYAGQTPLNIRDPTGLWCQFGPIGLPGPFGSGDCSDDVGAALHNAEVGFYVLPPSEVPAVARPGTINYALAHGTPAAPQLGQGGGSETVGDDETCTLFRAVDDRELADIVDTGTYRVPPGGVEGKYFYPTAQQAARFAQVNQDRFGKGRMTLTSTRYPRSSLPEGVYIAGEGDAYFLSSDEFPLGPVDVRGEIP